MEPINSSALLNSNGPNLNSTNPNYDNICAICRDTMTENFHKLSCNHSYHTACIIEWFRNSPLCPMCRSEPETYIYGRTERYARNARLKFNLDFAKRKDAPVQLKNMVKKLKKWKDKFKVNNQNRIKWKKSPDGITYTNLRKIHDSFMKKKWSYYRPIRRLETEIKEYPILYIPVLERR
jgi:hypothetical protein